MMNGAPPLAPNWLNRNGGRTSPERFANQSLAFSLSFRRKSYSEKCRSLVPDFVITLKTPPAARPYSALKALVSTLNSCTESTLGYRTGPLPAGDVLGAPSSRYSFMLPRAPFTEAVDAVMM